MPAPVMVQSAPAQPSGFESGTGKFCHMQEECSFCSIVSWGIYKFIFVSTFSETKTIDVIEHDENGGAEATINNLLANNKEKTPMCLVNELARYNKVYSVWSLWWIGFEP